MTEKLECLEYRKLELEILELRKSFWQKPGFLVPFLAALMSLGLGHFSGWFDVQTKLLEIKRYELNKDIASFKQEKQVLIAEHEILLDQVATAKKLRDAQSSYVSMEVLKFKELIRSGELPECDGCEVFLKAIENRFLEINDADLEAELELLEFELNNEDDISARENKLIEYMNNRGILDDDGCFEDRNGETHCTNF